MMCLTNPHADLQDSIIHICQHAVKAADYLGKSLIPSTLTYKEHNTFIILFNKINLTQQIPHIDTHANETQHVFPVTPAPPTIIYKVNHIQGKDTYRRETEVLSLLGIARRDFYEDSPILSSTCIGAGHIIRHSRAELEKTATTYPTPNQFGPGWGLGMKGGTVHAAPVSNNFRAMLFFISNTSATLQTADRDDTQHTPITMIIDILEVLTFQEDFGRQADNATPWKLLIRNLRDWAHTEPWSPYYKEKKRMKLLKKVSLSPSCIEDEPLINELRDHFWGVDLKKTRKACTQEPPAKPGARGPKLQRVKK